LSFINVLKTLVIFLLLKIDAACQFNPRIFQVKKAHNSLKIHARVMGLGQGSHIMTSVVLKIFVACKI
jgi:hypothetical protein